MCVNIIKHKFNRGVQHFIWVITVEIKYTPGYVIQISDKSVGVKFFQWAEKDPPLFAILFFQLAFYSHAKIVGLWSLRPKLGTLSKHNMLWMSTVMSDREEFLIAQWYLLVYQSSNVPKFSIKSFKCLELGSLAITDQYSNLPQTVCYNKFWGLAVHSCAGFSPLASTYIFQCLCKKFC